MNGRVVDRLTFLGTGDAMGVPRVYCDCEVCEEARNSGTNRRLRSSVLIESTEGDFLIDCGPDWRLQMEMTNRRADITDIVITHAHFDHIAGLPEWADACRWQGVRGRVYAPQEVLDIIQRQYPWIATHLDMIANDEGMTISGWKLTPWKVHHGFNGYSYAYRLEKHDFGWVYCPDAIGLTAEQKVLMDRLDLLILGTSFVHEEAEYSGRSVYDMREAAELVDELAPIQTIYTHMSHGVDLRQELDLPVGASTARTGMTIDLGNYTVLLPEE
ncbi:MBL fold metallo-hydrolase [Paenibacillus bovis]|uniref:MBL fold metallo-hydrolase n=1 Tax=Paenibacillus bovis TaxID=1616788 RepID=A0A172ZEW2_9BACL|nr:MBL fold metallo-hydrolase [Paenibacillus bovis]ANF96059.1 MBL fold metallo-hydrolase [Paenibacillus bovis]